MSPSRPARRPAGRARAGLAAAALAAAAAGCAHGAREQIVVRVGGLAITHSALERRMAAIAPEGLVPDPPRYTACVAHEEAQTPQPIRPVLEGECRERFENVEQRALRQLISWGWLIGEAGDRGLGVIDRGAARGLTRGSASGASGETELRLTAKLAAARLRQMLASRQPRTTAAEVAGYYRAHLPRFERPERREVEILEIFTSAAAARQAMTPKGFARLRRFVYHESLDRSIHPPPPRRRLTGAIFAAQPGALGGPVALYDHYSIFRVTRVTPATRESLASARQAIARRLQGEHWRRTLARFLAGLREKWKSKTECHIGYVVQGCRNYEGPTIDEAADGLG